MTASEQRCLLLLAEMVIKGDGYTSLEQIQALRAELREAHLLLQAEAILVPPPDELLPETDPAATMDTEIRALRRRVANALQIVLQTRHEMAALLRKLANLEKRLADSAP